MLFSDSTDVGSFSNIWNSILVINTTKYQRPKSLSINVSLGGGTVGDGMLFFFTVKT